MIKFKFVLSIAFVSALLAGSATFAAQFSMVEERVLLSGRKLEAVQACQRAVQAMHEEAVQAASTPLGVIRNVKGKPVVNDIEIYRKMIARSNLLNGYCQTVVDEMAQAVVDEIVVKHQPFTKYFAHCNYNLLDRTGCGDNK